MWRVVGIWVLLMVVGCNRALSLRGADTAAGGRTGGLGSGVDAALPDVRSGVGGSLDGAGAIDGAPASDVPSVDAAREVGAGMDAFDATPADISPARGCYSNAGGELPPPVGALFGAPVTLPLPHGSAESVAIGDVDGDGRPDVVVGEQDLIAVYSQIASGTLGPPLTYASGIGGQVALEPRMLDLGDVNGDGRLDVVFSREADVGVMLQNTAGGLDPPFGLAKTDSGNGDDAVAVGDLDGDGRADVAGASWGGTGIDVWFQTPDGALAPAQHFQCPHSGYESLTLGDLDGDGRLDIAIGGQQQSTICVLLQRPGGFAPGMSLSAASAGGLGIADVEGDCTGDLIFDTGGNQPSSELGVIAGAATRGFAPAAFLPSYDIPGTLVVSDVDGDGRPDVVVNHEGWEAIGVYRQLPAGGLAAEERYPFSYINWGPDRIAVGDINGDGRPDIVGVDGIVTILYHK